MTDGGWVKIWRGMMESCRRRRFGLEFCGAMVWLILEAAYRGFDDPLLGRLEPGDVAVSLRRLSAAWCLTVSQVRTVVSELVGSGFMVPVRSNRRWGTVFRIANYSKYQGIASPFHDDVPEAAADGEGTAPSCASARVSTQHLTQPDIDFRTLADGRSTVAAANAPDESRTLSRTQPGTQPGTLDVCARTRGIVMKEEKNIKNGTDRPAREGAPAPARPSAPSGASPSPSSSGGIGFDPDREAFFGPKLEQAVEIWRQAYPRLDVGRELAKARQWLADNASCGAAREDVRLWLAHWMAKAERLRKASETRVVRRGGPPPPESGELSYEAVREDAAFLEL